MKTILLKIAGPLQSWGTNSHFETRQTDLYPSKSALIGLIAASFGYKRDEDSKIKKLNELTYAVRIDQQGNLLRDYHIAQKFKNNGNFDRTYVTNRYYLEDAIFVVALSHDDDKFIEEIYENVQNPYFQTFMGRRSCPPPADFLLGVFEDDIIDILKSYPWQAKNWYKKHNDNAVSCYMDASIEKNLKVSKRRDMVISFSQKERKYQYRNESQLIINLIDPSSENNNAVYDEHDAYGSL